MILYLIICLLKNFDLLQILGGTTCVLFIRRFCKDSSFSTNKVLEGFLQITFVSVNENLKLLHEVF